MSSFSSTTTPTTRTRCSSTRRPASRRPSARSGCLACASAIRPDDALPNNVTERKVVPIYKFDRAAGEVTATVQEKSNLYLHDFLGTLPGSRITVSSITEDQLSFRRRRGAELAALQNLAERTTTRRGATSCGASTASSAETTAQAFRSSPTPAAHTSRDSACRRTCRPRRLSPSPSRPKPCAVSRRHTARTSGRYALNCTPLKETTQVEAIVEMTANVTRGSVGGGEDLLTPNPVVDILEVSQGATIFRRERTGSSRATMSTGSAPAMNRLSARPTPCAGHT